MYAKVWNDWFRVAPFVGAWIETMFSSFNAFTQSSLPSWERGLKRRTWMVNVHCSSVAPFVGAWIETPSDPVNILVANTSLPSWERGLKQVLPIQKR